MPSLSLREKAFSRRIRRAMTHVPYIIAAYLATALVLIGMVAWVTIDLREQKRKLLQLEAEGRRRSGIPR